MLPSVLDPLKQRFTRCKFRKEDISLTIPTSGNDSDENSNSKFLKRCTGEQLPFLAVFSQNVLKIRNTETDETVATHGFDQGWEVVDIDYLPSSEGHCGFLVGINDVRNSSEYPAMVVLLSYDQYQLSEVASMAIQHEISCLKVLLCDEAMQEASDGIHPRMAKWSHIFAVGTNPAHCFIASFPDVCASRQKRTKARQTIQQTLTDGLRSYTNSSGIFTYDSDQMKQTIRKNLNDIFVSSLGFVHRSRDLLIGLSFGGIVTISLSPKASITSLQFVSANPVRHFVPLEPDDDPRCHQFFLAFIDKPQGKQLGLVLYEGSVPDEEHLPATDRTFAGVQYSVRLMHSVPMSSQWVSAHVLVRDTGRKNIDHSSICDASILETSRLGTDTDSDRSLVFFSFLDNKSRLMGGLFDINQYYYKRLLPSIEPDATAARQNPFFSLIWPCLDEEVHRKGVILDVTPGRIMRRFQSNISTSEQMFYPSSFEMPCLHVATSSSLLQLSVPCIANQVVKTICYDIDKHLVDNRRACSWLSAIGLASTDVIDRGRQVLELSDLLRTLVCHGDEIETVFAMKHAIRRMNDEPLVLEISEWAWCEVDRARQKMDEITLSLFSKVASELSPEQRRYLSYIKTVFVGTKALMEECTDALKRLGEGSPNIASVTNLKARALAVDFLVSFVSAIYNLLSGKLLPLRDSSKVIRVNMEREVSKRRQRSTENGKTLNIDGIVDRIHRVSSKEPFWLEFRAENWYPPVLHNALLPMLTLSLSSSLKKQLLIYFLFDYVQARHQAEKNVTVTGSALCEEVIPLVHNVLNSTAADVFSTYEMWMQDSSDTNELRDENLRWSLPEKQSIAALEDKIQKYLNVYPHSKEDESMFIECLNQHAFGNFIKQAYLFKHKQYDDIDISLPLPSGCKNKWLENYVTIKNVARKLGRQNKAQASIVDTPMAILSVLKNAPGRLSPVIKRINLQPKTPLPLWKRAQESQLGKRKSDKMQIDDTNQKAMDSFVASDSIMKTPEMEMTNLPADVLNGISSVLHTPTSRARAAAKAEHQLSFDVTPEYQRNIVNPTSILKSAKKGDQGSPSRPKKFRFDLPEISPRLDFSSNESPQASACEEESLIETTLPIDGEEEDRHSNLEANDSAPQSEEPDASTAPLRNEQSSSDPYSNMKLVDYSLSETTMMESPSYCRKWMTDDGIQHSFEEQPETETDGEDQAGNEIDLEEQPAKQCNRSGDNISPIQESSAQDLQNGGEFPIESVQEVHTEQNEDIRLSAGENNEECTPLTGHDQSAVMRDTILEEKHYIYSEESIIKKGQNSSPDATVDAGDLQNITVTIEHTTRIISPKKVLLSESSCTVEATEKLDQTSSKACSQPSTSHHNETINLDLTDVEPIVSRRRRAASVVSQPAPATRKRTTSACSDYIPTCGTCMEGVTQTQFLPITETPKSPSRRSVSRNLSSDFLQTPIETELNIVADAVPTRRSSSRCRSTSKQPPELTQASPSRQSSRIREKSNVYVPESPARRTRGPSIPKAEALEAPTPSKRGRPRKVPSEAAIESTTPARKRAASTSQVTEPITKVATPSRRGRSVLPDSSSSAIKPAARERSKSPGRKPAKVATNQVVIEKEEKEENLPTRMRSSSRIASYETPAAIPTPARRTPSRTRKASEPAVIEKIYGDIDEALNEKAVDENGKKLRGRKLMQFSVEFKQKFKLDKNGHLIASRRRTASDSVDNCPAPKKASIRTQPTIEEEPAKVDRRRSRSSTRAAASAAEKTLSAQLEVVDPQVAPRRRSTARASSTTSDSQKPDVSDVKSRSGKTLGRE